jgi:adenylate cyclase
LRWNDPYSVPVLAMVAIVMACGLLRPPVFGGLSNFMFDTWQRIEPRKFARDGPVRIISIDEASLEELGQWPWPRVRLAEATRWLADLGAAGIAFDIIFNEPDRSSAESIVTSPAGELRPHGLVLGGRPAN